MPKTTVELDLIELITNAATGEVLKALGSEKQSELIHKALVSYITEETTLLSYAVTHAIRDKVTILALERLEDNNVQTAMKASAYRAVDEIVEGFAVEAGAALSKSLQSEYKKIVESHKNG